MKRSSATIPAIQSLMENLSIRLFVAFLGAGILLVARIYRAAVPEQAIVASFFELIAALMVAIPVFFLGIKGLRLGNRQYVAEQLVSLAVLAALATGDFPTATLVPLFLLLGHVFEERSILGARRAIAGLSSLTSLKATIIEQDGTREIAAEDLTPDDVISVKPGDAFPADGRIQSGFSTVDQSPVTGESAPQDIEPGDEVFAGSINMSGVLTVIVTKVGNQTALGRVRTLLEEASLSKPPVIQMMQKYAALYLPAVLTLAVGVFLLTRTLDRAISVLVISCPCAFVLAGPAAIVAALAVASRHGILIKGASFLERMAEVDTVILDKTGTATLGQLAVDGIVGMNGVKNREILTYAAVAASGSHHPVATAILQSARAQGIDLQTGHNAKEFPGRGTEVETDFGLVRMGREEWLRDCGLEFDENSASDHVGPITWIAKDNDVLGAVLLSDRARPEVKEAIRDLRALGVNHISLVTGDRKRVAQNMATSLEVDEVQWELLPEEKLSTVRAVRQSGKTVMVVGDGVNDALALAAGDVGVAMGAAGVQVAIESADVALMHNDLRALPAAVQLSRETRSTININVLIGGGYSVLMLSFAALGIINPVSAALLHNLGSFFVLVHSSRLLHHRSRHLPAQ